MLITDLAVAAIVAYAILDNPVENQKGIVTAQIFNTMQVLPNGYVFKNINKLTHYLDDGITRFTIIKCNYEKISINEWLESCN